MGRLCDKWIKLHHGVIAFEVNKARHGTSTHASFPACVSERRANHTLSLPHANKHQLAHPSCRTARRYFEPDIQMPVQTTIFGVHKMNQVFGAFAKRKHHFQSTRYTSQPNLPHFPERGCWDEMWMMLYTVMGSYILPGTYVYRIYSHCLHISWLVNVSVSILCAVTLSMAILRLTLLCVHYH